MSFYIQLNSQRTKLTIYKDSGFLDGLLISDVALQEVLGDVGVEVSGLVPTNLMVVHIDRT